MASYKEIYEHRTEKECLDEGYVDITGRLIALKDVV